MKDQESGSPSKEQESNRSFKELATELYKAVKTLPDGGESIVGVTKHTDVIIRTELLAKLPDNLEGEDIIVFRDNLLNSVKFSLESFKSEDDKDKKKIAEIFEIIEEMKSL